MTISSYKKHLPLLALCLGFFMVILDVTVVNVALPSIAHQLHGGVSDLQWIVDGYTLSFAALLLSAGYFADRLGAKKSFIWGLSLFSLTSLGCGLASHFIPLIIFRFLQGIGAALIVPSSLSLLNACYNNPADRAKAIGIWASIGGIAAGCGPLLGGILTAAFGWPAVFLVNVPIGIITLLLTLFYVVNTTKSQPSQLDLSGQLIAICCLSALAFSLIEVGRLGWLSPWVISGFILFLLSLVAFFITEHRTASPMLPLTFFKIPTFSASLSIGLGLNLGSYGLFFLLPLYFQQIKAFSVLQTGLAITPYLVFAAFSSYFGGKMASLQGARTPIILGMIISGVGFTLMFVTLMLSESYIALIIPLILTGIGTSFVVPAINFAAINSITPDKAGIAAGAFNTSRQVGNLIGVAIFGSIVNMTTTFMTGMYICLLLAAIVYFGGGLIAAKCVRQETPGLQHAV